MDVEVLVWLDIGGRGRMEECEFIVVLVDMSMVCLLKIALSSSSMSPLEIFIAPFRV